MIIRRVTETTPTLSPPLKWAGGKRWLLPEFQKIWHPFRGRRLIEPFVGGMAIALGVRPAEALLNDINRHLINFYRCLQRGLLIEAEMVNDETAYYEARTRFNELITLGEEESEEAAGLFYYLNRTGYNGLCRFNRKGLFNVPYGKYNKINYVTDFQAYVPTLQQWQLRSGDFATITLASGDFIYADPPYDVEFRAYSEKGFEWEDQVRLAEWLAEHDGPVVVSNQATQRILELYRDLGFQMRPPLTAPRRIAANGDRTPAVEMLATRGI